jgi:hypothetical protein
VFNFFVSLMIMYCCVCGAHGFLVLLQALLHVQAEFIMAFLLLGFQAILPVFFKQGICFLGCL